jgi:hypothetical protein
VLPLPDDDGSPLDDGHGLVVFFGFLAAVIVLVPVLLFAFLWLMYSGN